LKLIPNLLSLARLALAPYTFFLLWQRQYVPVIWLFAILGITDVVDGYLARRLNAASRLGAYIDPLADKVLLSGTFLVLALQKDIEPWLAGVVLGRDLLILAVAGMLYLFTKRRNFPPSPWGKISTFAQIAFVLFAIGRLAGIVSPAPANAFKWAVVALVVVSTLDYARRICREPAAAQFKS
jgi:cardiolipin synthase